MELSLFRILLCRKNIPDCKPFIARKNIYAQDNKLINEFTRLTKDSLKENRELKALNYK